MEESKAVYKVLFVGGDDRQLRAANRVAENGTQISVLGFSKENTNKMPDSVSLIENIDDNKFDYTAVVLPLPYSSDGVNINAPQIKQKLPVEELLKKLPPKSCVLAGKCDSLLRKLAASRNITLIDYFDREDLQILNAVPTAEGAIQIAMQELPFTLHSSKCLIIGNGRIGKILAKMLHGIGTEVTVAARKRKDIVQAFAYGYKSISTGELYDVVGGFDVIFNTAPSLILDFDLLSRTRRDSLVIDLASKPGGVDFETARKMGIKVIWALSLPGKVAPHTAGDIIGRTIISILNELEAK